MHFVFGANDLGRIPHWIRQYDFGESRVLFVITGVAVDNRQVAIGTRQQFIVLALLRVTAHLTDGARALPQLILFR